MAGVTFSIGGTNFLELGPAGTTGRYALACVPANGLVDRRRFHIPGTSGNLTIDCGEAGRPLVCIVRYIHSLTQIESMIFSDQAAWDVTAGVEIVLNGVQYTRCHLMPGAMKKISPIQATGFGTAFVNVEAPFICDGGAE